MQAVDFVTALALFPHLPCQSQRLGKELEQWISVAGFAADVADDPAQIGAQV
jgi:hypothetical protein